jgi:hypothetical protein
MVAPAVVRGVSHVLRFAALDVLQRWTFGPVAFEL